MELKKADTAGLGEDVSVVVLKSDLFDLTWPKVESPQELEENPRAKDCAEYFLKKLSAVSTISHVEGPFAGAQAWHVYLRTSGKSFRFTVNGVRLRGTKDDQWAIQIGRPLGCLTILKGQRPKDLMPLVELINEIVHEEPRIREAKWFTPEEFRKVH